MAEPIEIQGAFLPPRGILSEDEIAKFEKLVPEIYAEVDKGKTIFKIGEIEVYIKVPITDFELGLWERFYRPIENMVIKDVVTAVAAYLAYRRTRETAEKAGKKIVVSIPQYYDLRIYKGLAATAPVIDVGPNYKVTITATKSAGSVVDLLFISTKQGYLADSYDPVSGTVRSASKNVQDRLYLVRGVALEPVDTVNSYIEFIYPMMGERDGEKINPRWERLPNNAMLFRKPYICVGDVEFFIKARLAADVTSDITIHVLPKPCLIYMVTKFEEVIKLGEEFPVG